MTALSDISARLAKLGPVAAGHKRFVVLGPSAIRSVQCETANFARPAGITYDGTRFEIVETDQFNGFEVVDRPVKMSSLAGVAGKRR